MYISPVPDPDLQIRGWGGYPHPEIRGAHLKKNFFQPFGPQFGLKIGAGGHLDLPLHQPTGTLQQSCIGWHAIC